MKLLLFVSVFAVVCCLGVLVAVMASNSRKSDRRDKDDETVGRGSGRYRPPL